MPRSAEILNELKNLQSVLADLPCEAPFVVPEGYFTALTPVLWESVRASNNSEFLTVDFPKALPFYVPDEYFSGLAESMLEGAKSESIGKREEAPYEVPQGYFQSLPATLAQVAIHTTQPQKKRKRIDLRPQWRSLSRLAAAAVLVVGLGFGGFHYFRQDIPEHKLKQELTKIDAGAIDNYVEQHLDDFDAESLEATVAGSNIDMPSINTLDASEIQDYLQKNGELTPHSDKETL